MPAVKREYTSSEDENNHEQDDHSLVDHKPDVGNDSDFQPSLSPSPSSKKKKAKPSTPSKAKTVKSVTSTPTKKKSNKSDVSPKKEPTTPGVRKVGAWSGEELKALYNILCPKRVGVNWADVANQMPGRDTKSCQNKWARMQAKLMQAIEDLGE
ncbi:hypothetical protein I316_01988 [Kwoniella heveanensis BCC8398]|uniref:Myb-like domain-containing protein n=1 Tax=Kwoniella heveanensis BCC8398 TaxID=1296120 RepID=A0A1B9GYL4_9TREE|nr:hypothetical protein I316_01988 [Kwoniella heveanensis BCC8398]